jgi:hypothetical protein
MLALALGSVLAKHSKHSKDEPDALQPADRRVSHTLKVLAAGQGDTANQWLYHRLCSAGFKTMHTSVTCAPKAADSCTEECRRASNQTPMKRFNSTFAKLLSNRGLGRMKSPSEMRYLVDQLVAFADSDELVALVDFPVFYFFDELHAAFPGATVLMSTRNATEWARKRGAHNLICREAVTDLELPSEGKKGPPLPHAFALLPCLERQLAREGDADGAFARLSDLQANETGIAQLAEAFEAYNRHVRRVAKTAEVPYAEVDILGGNVTLAHGAVERALNLQLKFESDEDDDSSRDAKKGKSDEEDEEEDEEEEEPSRDRKKEKAEKGKKDKEKDATSQRALKSHDAAEDNVTSSLSTPPSSSENSSDAAYRWTLLCPKSRASRQKAFLRRQRRPSASLSWGRGRPMTSGASKVAAMCRPTARLRYASAPVVTQVRDSSIRTRSQKIWLTWTSSRTRPRRDSRGR